MKPVKYYDLVQTDRTANLYIFGDITSWPWQESDVSSYLLSRQLQELDVDRIDVHINSYGGEVAEGWAIYNSLKNHKAKIRTICDGMACSIASVIFMAGDERIMNNVSTLMIHNAWSSTTGNASAHRKEADDLDKVSKLSAKAYRDCVSIDDTKLEELLANESFIGPEEALEMGFATSISAVGDPNAVQQSAKRRIMRQLMSQSHTTTPAPQEPPAEKDLSTFLSALCKGGKE